MALTDIAPPSSFDPAIILSGATAWLFGPEAAWDAQDARARRTFVQEMLTRNPEAFSSDLDVQAMMHHYPGHF